MVPFFLISINMIFYHLSRPPLIWFSTNKFKQMQYTYFFLLCFWQNNPFLVILFKMMTKINFIVVKMMLYMTRITFYVNTTTCYFAKMRQRWRFFVDKMTFYIAKMTFYIAKIYITFYAVKKTFCFAKMTFYVAKMIFYAAKIKFIVAKMTFCGKDYFFMRPR